MVPKKKKCEKCGNVFTKAKLESHHPVIHHIMPTRDSRNSTLSVYYLETDMCDCVEYYNGEEERLVRTSPPASKGNGKLHFVSVDLLNEYLRSLYGKSQEGKSIDAFINNKNSLNCEEIDDKTTLIVGVYIVYHQQHW